MSEHRIQNEIRLALAGKATVFRGQVGQAWTGAEIVRHGRDVYIRDARPFSTGLPPGFSDLFGLTPLGRFLAIEVKDERGRVSEDQARFIEWIKANGGLAGVARSVDDALRIIKP